MYLLEIKLLLLVLLHSVLVKKICSRDLISVSINSTYFLNW